MGSMAISQFCLVNGWHTLGTPQDSNTYTNIMLDEDVENCWSLVV